MGEMALGGAEGRREGWGLILKSFDKALLTNVDHTHGHNKIFKQKSNMIWSLCVRSRKDNWTNRHHGWTGGGREIIEKAMTTVLRGQGIESDSRIPSLKKLWLTRWQVMPLQKQGTEEKEGQRRSKVATPSLWCGSCPLPAKPQNWITATFAPTPRRLRVTEENPQIC